MAKKKVCKQCRMFVEEEECPNCKSGLFTTTWKGRLSVINPEKSVIAKNIGLKAKGEYAIKIR
ncbi:DNA-directed RNA polymerase subunit E'' [Candidatus Woesearchaeota archaeon]|nr:DNA-directed RNA polymerase subunit E'' [Candidatus Woesearchaeota archaeon]